MRNYQLIILLLQLKIPFLQAKDGIPKFKYFTSTLSSRSLADSKSEVSEAAEILNETLSETEKDVSDVLAAHHFHPILIIHHLFGFSKGGLGMYNHFPILLLVDPL